MKNSAAAKRKGLIIINTGHGKGKTTAALGLMMRARGRNMKVIMLQFIKSKKSNYGEHLIAKKLGIKIIPMGGGCTWTSKDLNIDKALARKAWEKSKKILASKKYDIVALDELTFPINFRWISVKDVIRTIKNKPKWLHVIVTGRDAPKSLIKLADIVTEMKEIKHAFQKGILAQPGIEF